MFPRVFTEMRSGVDKYKIRRLNNETPRYAGTCAKNEGGHGSHGGTKTSRDERSDASSSEYAAWSSAISFNLAKLRDFAAGQLFNRDHSVLFYSISWGVANKADYYVIKIPCDLPLLERWDRKKAHILRKYVANKSPHIFLLIPCNATWLENYRSIYTF